MLPQVILRTVTSVDGRITNFPADLGLYSAPAAQWNPDAVLFGSETVLASVRDNPVPEVPADHEEMFRPPEGSPDPRPQLVIADSRGQVRCWDAIRKWPYMRDVMALCSGATPREYLGYLEQRGIRAIIAGSDRIDMREALGALNRESGAKAGIADMQIPLVLERAGTVGNGVVRVRYRTGVKSDT